MGKSTGGIKNESGVIIDSNSSIIHKSSANLFSENIFDRLKITVEIYLVE